jgi:hypothetical protein
MKLGSISPPLSVPRPVTVTVPSASNLSTISETEFNRTASGRDQPHRADSGSEIADAMVVIIGWAQGSRTRRKVDVLAGAADDPAQP